MALCRPRCGLITTNQEAMRSKESSPYWRAGLLMLGPQRDSRPLLTFTKPPRVEVVNIIQLRGIHWRRICKRNGLRTRFTAVSDLLERPPSLVTNRRYRGKFTRENKQLQPRKKDTERRLAHQQHHGLRHRDRQGTPISRMRYLTGTEPPLLDRDATTTAQSRTLGSIGLHQHHKPRHQDQQDIPISSVQQLIGKKPWPPDEDMKPTAQSKMLSSIAPQQLEIRHLDRQDMLHSLARHLNAHVLQHQQSLFPDLKRPSRAYLSLVSSAQTQRKRKKDKLASYKPARNRCAKRQTT